ncbi:hypothetical protein D5F01_LYC19107 [Xyrichtys novacula]|uniref:Endonuclease/exonuclease/phosphatase domain-containing protein n=1 Tax=Xyrichtys novacula TaxID=13765 RepID=A0AAV1GN81_XYRNO|nr:hypothetical protein D5F01_LYC19107 [Xyrichtys novacula]
MDRKPGVDYSVLRPLNGPDSASHSTLELLNVQSLTNKAGLITDKQIDILCHTETWQQPEVYSALNEACPPGYSYLSKARTTALIYRPPKPHPLFLSEIHDFLISLCTSHSNVLVLGDFNINMDSLSCKLAAEFKQVLDCLNLHQSVVGPTHTKGHTLDLVITDSIHISDLHVQNIGISDHYAVTFRTPLPSPLTKPQRLIAFRNFKNIDSTSLSQHLQLLSPPPNTSLTDLMDYYNHNLHSILDFHAPLKTRTVTFTRSAPWFTEELRRLKRTGRVLERAYVTSGLTVHKLAYQEHRRRYANEPSKARSAHYSNIINNNPVLSRQVTLLPPHNTCLNSPPQCSRRLKK